MQHFLWLSIVLVGLLGGSAPAGDGQLPIARVEQMPRLPAPFALRDWRAVTAEYLDLAFDFQRQGAYFPLLKWADADRNFVAMPSYVGGRGASEAINLLGALVSGALLGRDMRTWRGVDWVRMSAQYCTAQNDWVSNGRGGGSSDSFWYGTFPPLLFFQLCDLYPGDAPRENLMRRVALRWGAMLDALAGPAGLPDFDHTGVNLKLLTTVDNGRRIEPEGGAAVAWMHYMAWVKFHDPQFRTWAERSMQAFEQRPPNRNPLYEVLLPYGALLAARMNAEHDCRYDLAKWLAWCFEPGDRPQARPFWGVIATRFGDYDVHGLVGSVRDSGGYAFAMNSFQWAGALAPVPRYDARYARAIGKWLLNLANAARLFYADALPADRQDHYQWAVQHGVTHCLAYEGLRNHKRTGIAGSSTGRRTHDEPISPYATGDPLLQGWGPMNFCLYGSAHVGYLGGILLRTADERILRFDLLKTDFFHAPAWPTSLLYNPYAEARSVAFDVGADARDLYDAVTHKFIARRVQGSTTLRLAADTAAVIVAVPTDAQSARRGRQLLIDGRVIDYRADAAATEP